MAITTEKLKRRGVEFEPEQLQRLFLEALERILAPHPIDIRRELPLAEQELLRRGGIELDRWTKELSEEVASRSAAAYAALVGTGLTVPQAARLLGVNESRVRQRFSEGTLYGVKDQGRWRLPRFQFEAGRTLPGLEKVLPQLDAELHPLEVFNWFTLPNPDLEIDDRALSPRAWLLAGRDPAPVAELAGAL